MNIFVQKVGTNDSIRLTSETERSIFDYFWGNNNRILFLKDTGGDENYQLYGVNIDGSNLIALTAFKGVTTNIIDDLPEIDSVIIIGLNKRNPQIFDPYRLNIETGKMTMLAENPGNIQDWMTDHDGKLRLALALDGVNKSVLYRDSENENFATVMFYQWNRRVGWSTTDPMINSDGGTNWNGTDSEGTVWKKSNDPSPIGWRVPTFEEINTLLDTDKVSYEWTTKNGVNGGKFTDKVSGKSIFLPAIGDRAFGNSGELNISKEMGSYWSSTPSAQQGISFMSQLRFSSVQAGLFGAYRSYGFPVRCVAE